MNDRSNLATPLRLAALSRRAAIAMLATALFTVANSALAQGTATGPSTEHEVMPGPMVLIGTDLDPIPIDLDPLGPPWFKGFFDPKGNAAGDVTVDIIETIENVGTETWGDWHEHIIGDPASATAPSYWSAVVGLEVNGSPILFSAIGVGTKDLWLDDFSMPVEPGDILTIYKQVDVFNTAGETDAPLVRMFEFPTPVPEPSSILLAAMSLFALLRMRRRS